MRRALDDIGLLPDQTGDDRPESWGELPNSPASDVRRILDEKPPHHVDP